MRGRLGRMPLRSGKLDRASGKGISMKIYARWGLAVFAGVALAASLRAADVTSPMPGQAYYGGQQYYGPGYGPGYYGPMNNGCNCCGQAYGWPPPGSQPFSGWQGPPPDCGGSGRCGL